MAERYMVTFIDSMPSVGPSEVDYAEVLDSGWVRVRYRNFLNSFTYYPPQVIVSVQTPAPEFEEVEEPEPVPESDLEPVPEPEPESEGEDRGDTEMAAG